MLGLDPATVPCPMPDLTLCLGVLKHRAHLPAKKTFLRWIFAYVLQFKILKFPEHVCMTVCKGPHNLTSTGPHFS